MRRDFYLVRLLEDANCDLENKVQKRTSQFSEINENLEKSTRNDIITQYFTRETDKQGLSILFAEDNPVN